MKYIFFDLDGTLLDSAKHISIDTISLLRKMEERGFVLGISSGRGYTSVLPILKDTGLYDVMDVVIANCGSDILDLKTGTHERFHYLDKETIDEGLRLYRDIPEVAVVFHDSGRLFSTADFPLLKDFLITNGFDYRRDPDIEEYSSAPRMEIIFPEEMKEEYLPVFRKLTPKGTRGIDSDTFLYEIVPEDESKGKSILHYVESRGGTAEEVMCFGDGDNDLEMMEACGHSIAMRNAPEHVKRMADEVTEYTNDEEGVKRHLEKLFF